MLCRSKQLTITRYDEVRVNKSRIIEKCVLQEAGEAL